MTRCMHPLVPDSRQRHSRFKSISVDMKCQNPRPAESVKLALPGLQVCLSGRQPSHAVSVEPGGGATLGVSLIDWLTLVVKFEDVSEDREAGLHLGRRVL